jgi:hypothetical protein
MKKYSILVRIFVLEALFFYGLAAMPGSGGDTTTSALDTQVAADLAKLDTVSSISGFLNTLNSILNYVGEQDVSSQTQINYSSAVKRFDIYARRFASPGRTPSLTKNEVYEIGRFLKNLQNSTLFHSSIVSYVSSAISFWDSTAKLYGLTPYQKALKRKKTARGKH